MMVDAPNLQEIIERLEKVEKWNRRLKSAGLTVFAVAAAAMLMGQAAPKNRTIEAEKIVLRDASGNLRAQMWADAGGSGLVMYDPSGESRAAPAPQVMLSTNAQGPGLVLDEAKRKAGAQMVVMDGDSALRVHRGKSIAAVTARTDGPKLVVADDEGFEAVVGSHAFKTTRTTAAAVTLYGKDKNLIWRAPGSTVPTAAASPANASRGRPEVFSSVESVQGAALEWWPPSQRKTAAVDPDLRRSAAMNLRAAFAQACPETVATIERQRADYILSAEVWGDQDLVLQSIKYELFDRDGHLVNAWSGGAGEMLRAACAAVAGDWKQKAGVTP